MTRVRNIEAALPSLEKAIRGQTSHIHLAYIPGCEWHARVQTEKGHLLSSDLPCFMMDSYEECRDPPRLYLLDKFDNGGPGACLKRCSDPTFFEKAWDMLSKVKNAENAHKEKKHHKVKRKGSHTRNGELHNAPSTSRLSNGALPDMLIASQHDSQRFASPSSNTHSLSENRPIPDVRSNPDLISRSTSLGSNSRFSLVEHVADPVPVSGPSALPDETVCPSSSLKHEENDRDYYSNGAPISAPLSPPRSITWDEKAPIIATTSTVYSDDVIMDPVHIGPMFSNQDISPDNRKLPPSPTLVTANHEEVVSETEKYVDALNTLESETETEMEFHFKWEMNQLHDSGSKSDVKPISEGSDALQVDPSDDLLASQRSEAGNENVFKQHESLQNSGFTSSEVCEVSPSDGWSVNENVFMRESQSQEIFEIAPPETSSLVLNESSLMNAQATKFQTSDCSRDEFQKYSETSPTDFPEHIVPREAHLLDPPEEPYIENSPRVKIKRRNASRSYEFLEYTEIPPLAVLPSHPLPNQVVQSNVENGIIDHPHRSEEELGVSSTITNSGSVENEMQTTVSDVHTIHANGVHDAIRDETSNIEDAPFNVSSAKLWTNAGLFGLEPSKPLVFASANNPMEDVPHSGANGSLHDSSLSEADEHLSGNSTINLSHENKGNGTANLSSSFSSLAQRFLTNTLQKRISSSPPPLSHPEPATRASNIDSYARRSVQGSPSHHSTGQSSLPLEFMKISFYPMNGSMYSNIDEGMNYDARFPDFQILPDPCRQPGDSGSDSDEVTFGRSYAYSSEDLSPRLFSNSDVWDLDEIPDYSEKHPSSASAASASNYLGFEQAELHGIETVSNLNRNLNSNYVLENENQMPPPSPLPPVQWRLIKPPGSSTRDTSTNLEPRWQNHVPLPPVPAVSFPPKLSRNEEKPEVNGNVNHALMKGMKLEGDIIRWNRKKLDHQKSSGHEKPKRDAPHTKDLDEREELLYQIRNKSFNLRPTAKSNPDADSSKTPTNSSVSSTSKRTSNQLLQGHHFTSLLFLLLFSLLPFSNSYPHRLNFTTELLTSQTNNSSSPTTYFEVIKPIPLPKTQPFSLLLLQHDFAYTYLRPPVTSSYTPPSCIAQSPSRIVLEWHATCQGRQFDRIFGVWLGGVELLRSCTAEPRLNGIVWTVQKDVTKYTSLFSKNSTFVVYLGNLVDSTYTGVYHVNVSVHFYFDRRSQYQLYTQHDIPAFSSPADLVLPISKALPLNDGLWFQIQNSTDIQSKELTIPSNTYRAVVEVYVSFHSSDEFWYTNPSNDYIYKNNLTSSPGNGAFREVTFRLDNHVVGAVWPFTVIYTGGINPLLWRPITGIGSFNLPSYDIEITPFLGKLLDGKPHEFGFGVTNALDVWFVDANLHLWLDQKSSNIKGSLIKYDAPKYIPSFISKFKGLDGTFKIEADRTISSAGWVESSYGNITFYFSQELHFENLMRFKGNGTLQWVNQTIHSVSTTFVKDSYTVVYTKELEQYFPLYLYTGTTDQVGNTYSLVSELSLSFDQKHVIVEKGGLEFRFGSLTNLQTAQGNMKVNGNLVTSGVGSTQEVYKYEGTDGCYFRNVSSWNYTVLHDSLEDSCINLDMW